MRERPTEALLVLSTGARRSYINYAHEMRIYSQLRYSMGVRSAGAAADACCD